MTRFSATTSGGSEAPGLRGSGIVSMFLMVDVDFELISITELDAITFPVAAEPESLWLD